MRFAICDDDISDAEKLQEELSKLADETEIFCEIEEFFRASENRGFDAVFMDLDWNNVKDGIDYAKRLSVSDKDTPVVFVTGYAEDFIEKMFAVRLNVIGVIRKPVDDLRVKAVVERIVQLKLECADDKIICIKQGFGIIKVRESDILYIESNHHRVTLHMTDDNIYSEYTSFKEFADRMSEKFCIANKGIMVNLDRIDRIGNESVVFDNEVTVPVGRTRKRELKERMFNYIRG